MRSSAGFGILLCVLPLLASLACASSPRTQTTPDASIAGDSAVTLVPATGGSGGSSAATSGPSVGPLQAYHNVDPTLVETKGCAVDMAAVRQAATSLMDQAVDSAFRTYASTCFPYDYSPVLTINGGSGVVATPTLPDPGRPTTFTGTNNQVANVDEPDFIKTDGKYFYVATAMGVKIVLGWPPDGATVLSSIQAAGTPFNLVLNGTQLVVYTRRYPGATGVYAQALASYLGTPCTYGYDCDVVGDGSQTSILVFDVSDVLHPKLVRHVDLTGSFIAARRVGSTVHTLVYDGVHLPAVSVLPDRLNGFDPRRGAARACVPNLGYEQVSALFSDLHTRNRAAITALPDAAFLPRVDDSAAAPPALCDRVYGYGSASALASAPSQEPMNLLSLLSLDLAAATPVQATSIVSRPGVAYGSANAFYVGVRTSAGPTGYDQAYATLVHKFAFASGGTRYAGSGVAAGKVLNSFAMDEYQDVLRVAASTASVPSPNAATAVTVLGEQKGALVAVGALGGIAPGEDVRSVRFDGDRGYVVTFKKTDPLFVLGLGDPAHPTVLGELKVPGFSTYIHKMDDTHLLTVGYDAIDEGSFAWFAGVRIQIVDVTTLAQPKLLAATVIGTRGSSSDALTNHLAFTYEPTQGLLALPMTICEGTDAAGVYGDQMTFSGLLVFRAKPDGTLSELGRIPHEPLPDDALATAGDASCFTWWTEAKSAVKRSFFFDTVAYSVSEEAIEASRLADLAHPVSRVLFETYPAPPQVDGGTVEAGPP